MNRVMLMGYLTGDPETRYTPAGKAVVEWTIALNKRWKTEAGEEKERVSFIGCFAWGAKGEAFAKYHRKGRMACVEGELVQETWDDKTTGKKTSKIRVQVSEFHFTGQPKLEDGVAPRMSPLPGHRQPQAKAGAAPAAEGGQGEREDDVPF